MSENIENAEPVKLNLCPRCGSAPQLLFCAWDYQHDAPGGYYVMCMECLTICRTLFATAKEAADNWNTYSDGAAKTYQEARTNVIKRWNQRWEGAE